MRYTTNLLRGAVQPHSWGFSYATLIMSALLTLCAANAQNRAAYPQAAEASGSVLSSGRWVKLRIKQTGVYRITADMLGKWGFADLHAVSVWGNGCRGLSRFNREANPDDLLQVATKISENKILFYAEAKNTWRYNAQKSFFEHEQSEYSDAAYIYITDSKAVKGMAVAAQSAAATDVTDTYDYRDYRERIDTNLLRSGRRFFGEVYDAVRQHSLSFSVPSLNLESPQLKMQVCAAARSTTGSTYSISVNGGDAYTLTITPVTQNVDYMKADTALFENIPVSSENINLKITYNRPSNSASAWGAWDFTTINARANLRLQSSQLLFRDAQRMGPEHPTTRFNIATSQQNVKVWDVTDLHDAQEVGGIAASGDVSFAVETPTLREFVAFTDNMLLTPEYVSEVPNQNLHGAAPPELVIVTHPELAPQAERLADFHRKKDNMSVLTTTTEAVYNEFSGGLPDVSAIRNFMRMFYRRNAATVPKYLLLFGSGTYVSCEGKKGVGLIPTFQSDNSLVSERSYVSDDFFVLLDNDEYLSDAGMVGQLDMAVGRIPARSGEEAATLVDKIEQYSANLSGDWMSKCIIIADDEDGNDHMLQAEKIGSYIMDSAPSYYVNKIYMDAYVQQSTSRGERYPDVTDAINSAVCSGALLVNYTGHANDQWLSHEQIVTLSDIKRWNNRSRLPLFVTATCEFSRFDNPYVRSAGEQVLFLPNGGGIAMLSTTRLVFSSANSALNLKFIEEFFRKDASGKYARIGEMVRRTKNASTTGVNQLNFSLLGDPALMLHFPSLTAQTSLINGIPYATPDTLKALAKAGISGSVNSGNPSDTLYISIFDKEQLKQTLGNSGQTPFAYRTQSSLLYKGKVSAVNGSFTAKFIVPQDIAPSYGNGKIAYMGQSGGRLIAGSNLVPVGGISDNAVTDTTPPSIRMYMNDERWVPGGTTTESPTFVALLTDSSGINITGNGVGRDITLRLQPSNKTYILNSYYTANTDSYTSGRIEFPIPPLEKGAYTATLKAWDAVNNSAEQSIEFRVADDERFTLSRVLNYPNPFTQKTAFFFEHNRPYADMEALIQVFTISGKLVKTIRYSVPPSSASLRSAPIEWDGRDDYGSKLGRGVYLYKIKVRCSNGEYAEKVEKLVLLS
ncbi:MAG: type IX secretion system sortase PorU [Prevotellaceae bacterium]|nr:type IX secretion system sortase PorU [Prevotellaceae bacterium]